MIFQIVRLDHSTSISGPLRPHLDLQSAKSNVAFIPNSSADELSFRVPWRSRQKLGCKPHKSGYKPHELECNAYCGSGPTLSTTIAPCMGQGFRGHLNSSNQGQAVWQCSVVLQAHHLRLNQKKTQKQARSTLRDSHRAVQRLRIL